MGGKLLLYMPLTSAVVEDSEQTRESLISALSGYTAQQREVLKDELSAFQRYIDAANRALQLTAGPGENN